MIRGDSHYGAPEVYDFCEEEDLKYIFFGLSTKLSIITEGQTPVLL
jgi:hypothetical protein